MTDDTKPRTMHAYEAARTTSRYPPCVHCGHGPNWEGHGERMDETKPDHEVTEADIAAQESWETRRPQVSEPTRPGIGSVWYCSSWSWQGWARVIGLTPQRVRVEMPSGHQTLVKGSYLFSVDSPRGRKYAYCQGEPPAEWMKDPR